MKISELPPKYSSLFYQGEIDTRNLDADFPVKLSISTDKTQGFVTVELNFSQIPLIALSPLIYSPAEYAGGYRRLSNAIDGNNLIILDIDSGWNVRDAWSFIDDHYWPALITTTKSHQLPKNGEPARDRMRIFLPTKEPFKGTTNEFRCMMQDIFKTFQNIPDKATCDMSRCFFGNPNPNNQGHMFIDGWNLFDLNKFAKTPHLTSREIKLLGRKGNFTQLERYWAVEGQVGNRNNVLFKAYAFYKDQKLTTPEIVERVTALNRQFNQPLEDKEIETICRV